MKTNIHIQVFEQKLEDSRKETNVLVRINKFLGEFYDEWGHEKYIHITHLLRKNAELLKQIETRDLNTYQDIKAKETESLAKSKEIINNYPRLFSEACQQANMQICSDSKHPRYRFEQRFLSLEINDREMTAKLETNEGVLFRNLPADIATVLESLQKEYKRLYKRNFAPLKFLAEIRKQYLEQIKMTDKPDGTSVPIRNLALFQSKDKKFKSDESSIDLSKLLESGILQIDGKQMDLQQTKNTRDGILLAGFPSRGYIGFIIFK